LVLRQIGKVGGTKHLVPEAEIPGGLLEAILGLDEQSILHRHVANYLHVGAVRDLKVQDVAG
jgi:hypothetical protein